jgi:hypothetical protein
MRHRLAIAITVAILGALVFVLPADAQRGFAPRQAPSGRGGWHGSSRMGGRGGSHQGYSVRINLSGRGRPDRGRGMGWAYLPYPGYYEYPTEEPPPAEAPAPVEERAEQPAPVRPPERIPPSLLLERQGDRWVQVSGYTQSTSHTESATPELANTTDLRAAVPIRSEAAPKPPPAVLVFHDGHREEVKSYTIIGNDLYTSANYWTTGSWTKKIHITDLDLPATLQLNQERGSKFSLPSGPEEVMIRL